MAFTEDDLGEFYKLLTRQPPYAHIGGPMAAYPDGDENARKIYEIYTELERRGLAQRRVVKLNDTETIIFSAVEASRG